MPGRRQRRGVVGGGVVGKRLAVAVGWVLLFAAVGLAATIGLSELVPGWGGERWALERNAAYELIGFVVATLVVGRWLNSQSWERLGWGRARRPIGSWGGGLLLGVGMAAAAVGLAVVVGGGTLRLATHGGSSSVPLMLAGCPITVALIMAALAEELMFRGYPLQRLADAVGAGPATAVLALAFGLAHANNPNGGLFGTLNAGLAGVWLSVAFFSRGAMALAWGLHFGWNAGLAVLFNAPVSGFAFALSRVEYVPGRHPWIDGGVYGPEGGIVATLVFGAGCWLAWRIGNRSRVEA